MEGLTERRATAEDTATVVDIHVRAFQPYVEALGRAASTAPDWVPGDVEAGRMWVYEQNGEVVAAASQTIEPDQAKATINSIAVDPDRQGRGTGSRIMAMIEERLRVGGTRTLSLYTAAVAGRLVEFYKRHGFQVVRIGPREKDPDGFDRVYFEKSL